MQQMRALLPITLLLAVLTHTNRLCSQSSSIRFDNISIDDKLSQSSVNSIVQDARGFLWIGTQDGLNRYDGYDFQVFRNDPEDENSLSNNYIYSIYEDRDSNLWVGTERGLNRINARTHRIDRFLVGKRQNTKAVLSEITALVDAPENKLWVGTANSGLYLLDKETGRSKLFRNDPANKFSLSNDAISALYRDKQGLLWVGTRGGGINLVLEKEERFRRLTSANSGLSNDVVWSISEDENGLIWVATNDGVSKIKGRGINAKAVSIPEIKRKANHIVNSILCDTSGVVWVGSAGGGFSKLMMKDGSFRSELYLHDELDSRSLINNNVQTIFKDDFGTIWIGTNNGISKFDPCKQAFNHVTWTLNKPYSLNDKNVWSIEESKSGTLLVGTREGVNRIDPVSGRIKKIDWTAANPNAPNNNSIYALLEDEEGRLWMGAIDGLFIANSSTIYSASSFTRVNYKPTVANDDNRVYCLLEARDGYIWAGTREGLARINKRTLKSTFYTYDEQDPSSISENTVRSLMQDSSGNVWVGTEGGGLNKILTRGVGDTALVSFVHYENQAGDINSLGNNTVTGMLEGPEGTIWIGTYGGGLNKFDPNKKSFERYTEQEGLANNVVYCIVSDNSGKLWMSTNLGLSCLDVATNKFSNYVEADGLQSNEFNIGASLKAQDGTLYFGGINGFNYFSPEQVRANTSKPKVAITRLLVLNKEIKVDSLGPLTHDLNYIDELILDRHENSLTFEFSALHFTNSAQNRYRYILEGADDQWIEAGPDRSVTYMRLPPGEYTFKVLGSNSDGVWSENVASLKSYIKPPFWGTWWFRILTVFILIGLVYLALRIRTQTIMRQKETLSRLVAQRTKKTLEQKRKIEAQKKVIEEEKEKVDNLLMNVLPRQTVEELKTKGKASARSFNNVTIMFTDFKDFTKIAEMNDPSVLVERLDSYFSVFDEITGKYGIEKIKTIGDAYMCAGGIPIRNKGNAIDTVLAGLEIQQYMKERIKQEEQEGITSWGLRIGIHSGSLIAGVIGTKRFAYDIWGDAVNIANRIETAGEPGKVNVSGKTYELIEPYFECTFRGKIPAKNKGEINMYFVDRIKPELSVDGKGLEPNDQFWENVDLHLYSNIKQRNAEKYIISRLSRELDANLHYHGVHHTLDVYRAVEQIANSEGIKGEDLFLLKTAALYHDAGFVKQYIDNEPLGVEMAKEALPKFGYTDSQIEVISGLIYATAIPHDPKNHLQEIICDADLDYLGRDDFHEIADKLRMELTERGFIKSHKEWDEMQVSFLSEHRYFTSSSISLRRKKKLQHLGEIEERLRQYRDDNAIQQQG